MRRLLLVILLGLIVAPTATAATGLRAEKQRSRTVLAQVGAINTHLDAIVQRWDGARVHLGALRRSLRANEQILHIARGNLHAARTQLEQRLYDLYVNPDPGSLEVLLGSTSLTDVIDRTNAMHAFSVQDAEIADAARRLKRDVAKRETALRRQRAKLVGTIAKLDAQRTTIARELASERNLLASIHENIQRLTAQAAAEERRRAAAQRAQIARRVQAATAHAATAAITAVQPSITGADPVPATEPTSTTSPTSTTTATAPTAVPPPGTTTPPPPPDAHAEAASIAARYLGVPYVWGGESPAGFDCSGLVAYVYAQLGVSLPHYTVSQWDATIPISISDLQPGDLVFFDGLSHVGIYIGGGQFIHAPHTGTVVQIGDLSGYWAANLDGTRRVP